MQDGTEKEMNRTTARVVFWSLVFGTFLCAAMIVLSAFRAHAQEAGPTPEAKAKFFKDVTEARLQNGRTVNCCGEADATASQILGSSLPGLIAAQIFDVMRSKYGAVGDILSVPEGVRTLNIYNPFDFPVAFVREDKSVICLVGTSGG